MVLILSWENWSDQTGVTLTTDSEVSTLPVENVADPIISKVWRTEATSAYLQTDLGSARAIDFFLLARLTFTTTDTIRLRLGTSAGAGDLLDTGAVSSNVNTNYGIWAHVLATQISARYARLDFVATSRAALGYFDLGRQWIGTSFQPTYDAAYGYEDGRKDFSKMDYAERSGVALPLPTYQKRFVTFGLEALSETEALDDMREMERIAGVRNQIALIPDPDSTRINQEAIIGRMMQSSPIRRPQFGIYSKVFDVWEDK